VCEYRTHEINTIVSCCHFCCRCLLPVHENHWTSCFSSTLMGEGEIIKELWESIAAN